MVTNIADLFRGATNAECYIDKIFKLEKTTQVKLWTTPEEFTGQASLLAKLAHTSPVRVCTPKIQKTSTRSFRKVLEEVPELCDSTASYE